MKIQQVVTYITEYDPDYPISVRNPDASNTVWRMDNGEGWVDVPTSIMNLLTQASPLIVVNPVDRLLEEVEELERKFRFAENRYNDSLWDN